jgi:CBS domain containing-hemolysin-like protein
VGDSVTTDGVLFEVNGVDGTRIVEVDVTLKPQDSEPAAEERGQASG